MTLKLNKVLKVVKIIYVSAKFHQAISAAVYELSW